MPSPNREFDMVRALARLQQSLAGGRRFPELEKVLRANADNLELFREVVLLTQEVDYAVERARNRFGFPGR